MGVKLWVMLVLAGCGGGEAPSGTMKERSASEQPAVPSGPPAGESLTVQYPWIRLMPPGAQNTAGFMVLESSAATDHAVLSASAGIARSVELHTHTEEDGRMKMRRLDNIPLPAGQRVALQEGGHHVMFIGLNAELTEGQIVPVTLTLDDRSEVTVEVPVLRQAPTEAQTVGQ